MTDRRFTVIRGGAVLDRGPPRPPPPPKQVANGTIREIGPHGVDAPEEAQEISAHDRLLLPGLVNAHTHSHYTLAKGVAGNWTLEMMLNAGPWVIGGRAREDLRLGATLGAAEMIRKGCTACYDMVLELPGPSPEGIGEVAGAYDEVGMRAVVAPAVADRVFWAAVPGLLDAVPARLRGSLERMRASPAEATLAGARSVLHDWRFDRDRVRPALAPTIPLLCSDAFLADVADLTRDYDVFLHTHVAESKVQAVAALRRWGRTLTHHLDEAGILGPRFGAAHAVWLDDDDIRRLADRGAAAAHNPGSNLRLGNGFARAERMAAAGVAVGIGTDTSSCADQLNMFEAMRLAAFASRAETPDYGRWLGAPEVLDMATAGSARVLGFERIGRLEPGHAADIVFLDLHDLNYVPLNDACNQVVYCENGAAVDSVMVAGRMVYDRGRFATIDYDRLVERANARAAELAEANAGLRREMDAVADVVGAFCVGLAREPYHVHRYVGDRPGDTCGDSRSGAA